MSRVTIRNHGELVRATMNSMGHIVVRPASKRFKKAVKQYSVTGYDDAYIQHNVEAWVKEYVPVRYRRGLEHGWDVKFYLYDEVAWNLFGLAY